MTAPTTATPVAPATGTTAAGAAADPSGTSLAPTPGRLWRRSRGLLVAAALLVTAGLLYGGLRNDAQYPPLDPRSTAPDGTHAVTRLLERQGIAVDTAPGPGKTLDDGRPTTVLLLPGTLTRRHLQELRDTVLAGGGRVVLVSPGPTELSVLAPTTRLADPDGDAPPAVSSASTEPDCDLPEARRAGSAELGGLLYAPAEPAQGCYFRDGRPALVRSSEGNGDTVVLGSGRFLTNDRLDDDGNAALALGLLGAHRRLVWYLPDYDQATADSGAGSQGLLALLPAGWRWGLLQAAVAALLAALWRARRLGPVVPENLPVTVRASETTEGRARLYRRAKARDRAADALRRATRSRLSGSLGLPARPEAGPAALTAAVAGRLPQDHASGARTPAEVHALLYGAAPADDTALLRLADDLDTLERQVRQP
ncbi:DUF4350 domain-containing protein [Peterkaempfera sp. SMS 1(5)a]|uniref:DUF4350 domain-containing protein n=1 Tax=Peterkaempfera podocarpi TaxID=3232308 RepID=UPI00366C85D2